MLGPICCKSYNVNSYPQLFIFLLVQKNIYSQSPLCTRSLPSFPAEIGFFKSSDRGCRTKGPLPNLGRLTVYTLPIRCRGQMRLLANWKVACKEPCKLGLIRDVRGIFPILEDKRPIIYPSDQVGGGGALPGFLRWGGGGEGMMPVSTPPPTPPPPPPKDCIKDGGSADSSSLQTKYGMKV
jgi:hypothetical protein